MNPTKSAELQRDPAVVPGGSEECRISLDAMHIGQCGVVCDLELADGDDNRLRTLGICPGRRVWMVRRGDPMVLRVMRSRLGLAAELAKQVTVEVCAPPCSLAEDIESAQGDQDQGAEA